MTIENALKTFQEYYQAKNYTDARDLLEKHSSDIDPIIWHYNMGTTLAQLGLYAEARYHFLKAERKGLTTEKLIQSKSYVESKLETDKWEKSLGVKDYLISGTQVLAEGPLATFTLLIIGLFLIFFKRIKNTKSVYVWMTTIGLIIVLNYAIQRMPFKIMITSTPLYEGPSKIFIPRSEIPAGVVVLTSGHENWEKIIYPSRFEGWIIKTEALRNLGD